MMSVITANNTLNGEYLFDCPPDQKLTLTYRQVDVIRFLIATPVQTLGPANSNLPYLRTFKTSGPSPV